ncbi:MAG: FUSC family protein [Nocardioidaceae bacterium]
MSANPVARWRRKVPALPAAVTDNPDRRATRIPRSLQQRLADLKLQRTPIAQLAIGTSVAWFIANQLVGHLQPFFAPIAAVLTIYASVGQRRRTLLQLVLGVSIGILVGQFLILWIGHGAWQIAVIVALAATTASLLGLRGLPVRRRRPRRSSSPRWSPSPGRATPRSTGSPTPSSAVPWASS